jgi:hypothetical protein
MTSSGNVSPRGFMTASVLDDAIKDIQIGRQRDAAVTMDDDVSPRGSGPVLTARHNARPPQFTSRK